MGNRKSNTIGRLLKSSYSHAHASKSTEKFDRSLRADEIDLGQMAEMFFTNKSTVNFFITKGFVSPVRRVAAKNVFDRKATIKVLSLFTDDDGKLSTRMEIWKKGIKAMKQINP